MASSSANRMRLSRILLPERNTFSRWYGWLLDNNPIKVSRIILRLENVAKVLRNASILTTTCENNHMRVQTKENLTFSQIYYNWLTSISWVTPTRRNIIRARKWTKDTELKLNINQEYGLYQRIVWNQESWRIERKIKNKKKIK